MVLSSKTREWIRQQARGWDNQIQGRGDANEPDEEETPNCLASARAGQGGAADAFGDFAG